jgi:hypothetical protein
MQRQGEHCNSKGGMQANSQQGPTGIVTGLALTTVRPASAAASAKKEVNFMALLAV